MKISALLKIDFWIVLAFIFFMGSFSLFFFFRLGHAIDVILQENYESVRVARVMSDAVEKINALVLNYAGGRPFSTVLLKEYDEMFRSAHRRGFGLVTLAGEKHALENIFSSYERYLSMIEEMLRIPEHCDRWSFYDEKIAVEQDSLKKSLSRLIEINENAMREADLRGRRLASNSSVIMVLLIICAFMVIYGIKKKIFNSLFTPLNQMTVMATMINGGDFSMRLNEHRNDEFGRLAAEINRLCERILRQNEIVEASLIEQRQIVAALMETFKCPAVVVDVSGSVIAASREARELILGEEGKDISEFLRTCAKGAISGILSTSVSGASDGKNNSSPGKIEKKYRYEIVRLVSANGCSRGFLVQFFPVVKSQ